MTQHIVQRGNNRCAVFGNTSDYQLFLGLLQRESLRYAVAIHAYALMTTHFHSDGYADRYHRVVSHDAGDRPNLCTGL